ncbi:hypothetical protein HDU99_003486 [Rhizoclosmatium hyalinum]|nr:hypothetical protein HDU99_003486 [Rhizoclosmatium hyalinum]
MAPALGVTAAHPLGCSDPPVDATVPSDKFPNVIQNKVQIPLVFAFVYPDCTDHLISSPDDANASQVIPPGASQTLLMSSGSVVIALEALNNGQYGHLVSSYKSTASNGTWAITSDLSAGQSSNAGAIAGGVVGALLAIGLAVGGFLWWSKRNKAAAVAAAAKREKPATMKFDVDQASNSLPRPRSRGGNNTLPRGNTLQRTANNNNNTLQRYDIKDDAGSTVADVGMPQSAASVGTARRQVPRLGAATPQTDSLGRGARQQSPDKNNSLGRQPQQQNTNNNSLGRPLPNRASAGAITAPVPSAQPIRSVAAPSKVVVEEEYEYKAEPADPTAPGSRLRLRYPHTPDQDDELQVLKGDVVEIIEAFDDGWAQVRVVMSGLRGITKRGDVGMVPVGCLEINAQAGRERVMQKAKVNNNKWDQYAAQKKRASSLFSY